MSVESMLRGITYAVFLVYPATMFIYDGIRSEYLAVLFLLSLVALFTGHLRGSIQDLRKIDKLVLVSFASISIVAWTSYAYYGFPEVAKNRIEVYSWFALSIPIFLMFRVARPRLDIIWVGVILGAFVAGGRALLEEFALVEELAWQSLPGRANGVMHPIRFGALSLLLAFMSLAGALYLEWAPKALRVLGILAFLAGLVAGVLSESRGTWLGLPFFAAIMLYPFFRESDEQRRRTTVIVMSVALALAVIVGAAFGVGKRFEQLASDLELYFVEGNSKTSVGSRFDMFMVAIGQFREKPLFGVGVGNYHSRAVAYYKVNSASTSWEVYRWKNPHNEFLLHAATRGAIGLVVLLLMFGSLVVLFLGQLRVPPTKALFAPVSGLLIAVGYAIYGQSIALFEHRDFTLFFLLYVPLMSSAVFAAGSQE